MFPDSHLPTGLLNAEEIPFHEKQIKIFCTI